MADLADLIISNLLGGKQDAEIAATDPYAEFQAIPDSISKIVINAPEASLKDRIIGGALSGLLSGGAQSLSTDYQNRAKQAYTDTVLGLIKGEDVQRPDVLEPSVFGNAQKQATVFKAVESINDAERQKVLDAQSNAQTEDVLRRLGFIKRDSELARSLGLPKEGSPLVKLSELDPVSQAEQEAKARARGTALGSQEAQQERVKNIIEQSKSSQTTDTPDTSVGGFKARTIEDIIAENPNIDPKAAEQIWKEEQRKERNAKADFFKSIPSQDKITIMRARGAANRLAALEGVLDKFDPNGGTIEYQLKRKFSATEAGKIQAQLKLLAAQLASANEGGRPSEYDSKKYETVIAGDWTVGPRDVAKLVKQFKEVNVRLATDLIDSYVTATNEGPDALKKGIVDASQVTIPIPSGATDTGRTSGGKKVYRLPNGKLWVQD